jgi:hypothetical protein
MTERRPASIRATVADPNGVDVVLRQERWAHITAGHPELARLESAVLRAVSNPTKRLTGRSPGESWFYLDLGRRAPARWLKVVVRYERQDGWIVSALLHTSSSPSRPARPSRSCPWRRHQRLSGRELRRSEDVLPGRGEHQRHARARRRRRPHGSRHERLQPPLRSGDRAAGLNPPGAPRTQEGEDSRRAALQGAHPPAAW